VTPEELSDRVEIDHVLKTYFRGLDRQDFEMVRSCFFEDATIDLEPWILGSRDEAIAQLESPDSLNGYERTMHFCGNTIIELEGDVAHTEVYAMAQHTVKPDHEWAGMFVTTWLRYLDRFERRGGEWRSAKRKFVCEWIRKDTAGMWEEPPAPGRRDHTDPVFTFGR
jgi:hypothetical protein